MSLYKSNVLVMGPTGAGKSEFINFIYGNPDVRKSGSGNPVTEIGIHTVEPILTINNMQIQLFDTWGIEANKCDQWEEVIKNEIDLKSESSNIADWFHTIFYCINANGGRVQDFEVDLFKYYENKAVPLIIILTNSDVASDKKIEGISNAIRSEGITCTIINVCSVSKKTLGGTISKPFGRENVIENLFNDLWSTIVSKVPKNWKKKVENEITELKQLTVRDIENVKSKTAIFKVKDYVESILSKYETRYKKVIDNTELSLTEYVHEAIQFYLNYHSVYYSKNNNNDIDYISNILNNNLNPKIKVSDPKFTKSVSDKVTEVIAWGVVGLIPIINLAIPFVVGSTKFEEWAKEIEVEVSSQLSQLSVNIHYMENELRKYLEDNALNDFALSNQLVLT